VEMKTKKDENIAETHGKPRENIAMKVKWIVLKRKSAV
jgi:hypothetical protein